MNSTNFQNGLERRNLQKDGREIEFNWCWKIKKFQLYMSFVFSSKRDTFWWENKRCSWSPKKSYQFLICFLSKTWFLLTYNRTLCSVYPFRSDLDTNQIEELPPGVFNYNTELTILWVTHVYVHIRYYWLERRILPTAEEFKTQQFEGNLNLTGIEK